MQFTGAIEMLEETGIEAPKLRTEALMGRGNAQLKQQEHNQALADFTAVGVAAHPRSPDLSRVHAYLRPASTLV